MHLILSFLLFFQDFASAGHVWTADLCRADSDGDGVSNGVELGDPHCHWTPKSKPHGQAQSHPGKLYLS